MSRSIATIDWQIRTDYTMTVTLTLPLTMNRRLCHLAVNIGSDSGYVIVNGNNTNSTVQFISTQIDFTNNGWIRGAGNISYIHLNI